MQRFVPQSWLSYRKRRIVERFGNATDDPHIAPVQAYARHQRKLRNDDGRTIVSVRSRPLHRRDGDPFHSYTQRSS